MSFSRQYAKDRHTKKPNEPLATVPNKRSLSANKPNEKKTFSREKFRERKEALKAKQALWQKRQSQASRLNQNTVEEVPSSMHWKGIFLSILIIVLGIAFGEVWRHRDQWIFPIKEVVIEANVKQLNSPELQKILQEEARGSLLLHFPQALAKKIKRLPWVDTVSVERVWPGTLRIALLQKVPVARFGSTQFVDQRGELFIPIDEQAYGSLPDIEGPADRATQLLSAYQALNSVLVPMNLRITRFEVSPRLAYILTLSNGIVLYMGSSDVVSRLETFVKVYAKILQPRASEIDHVDMRYGSGMAVGWK